MSIYFKKLKRYILPFLIITIVCLTLIKYFHNNTIAFGENIYFGSSKQKILNILNPNTFSENFQKSSCNINFETEDSRFEKNVTTLHIENLYLYNLPSDVIFCFFDNQLYHVIINFNKLYTKQEYTKLLDNLVSLSREKYKEPVDFELTSDTDTYHLVFYVFREKKTSVMINGEFSTQNQTGNRISINKWNIEFEKKFEADRKRFEKNSI